MSQSIQQSERHSTDLEIAFITQLGTHSNIGESKKTLLEKYLRTIDLRVNWADMNKEKIRAAVEKQLTA